MKKFVILCTVILSACQLDEPEGQASIETMNTLSGGTGNSKTWKISEATLKNTVTGTTLDITGLANVQDDEFVFTSSPQNGVSEIVLSWRKRNEIRSNANESSAVLLDYYLSALASSISVTESGEIQVTDPSLTIKKISSKALQIITLKDGIEIQFELTPSKVSTEFSSFLNFTKVADISGKGLEQAAGFTGSMASNSLYIAYRSLEGDRPERVVRYDIDDNTFTTREFLKTDFVTKELHIINDKLKVIGARNVNTYNLDLSDAPVSVPHNLTLTRFGSTVVDDNVFIFGGDLNSGDSTVTETSKADEIYQHDQVTGTLNLVGKLPEPRFWAHGQIIDNNLYVFGGRKYFISSTAEDEIFIYNMSSGETTTLKLPVAVHRTFASRYQHYIIVGSQREYKIDNAYNIETSLNLFNTYDNSFNPISNSMNFGSLETIYGLTVLGDKLYVLKGKVNSSDFEIFEASL